MLLLMVILCFSVSCQGGQVHLMRSSKEVEFVSPINYYSTTLAPYDLVLPLFNTKNVT